MTDDQHIALGHVRVVGPDKMCFWVKWVRGVSGTSWEPVSVSCYDPFCFTDPLPCETISLSRWQEIKAASIAILLRRDTNEGS
jgi:hypothetical protein